MNKLLNLFNKKTLVKQDDLFILSSDKHKMNALFYDKIFPMHSGKTVPSKYQVDIKFSPIEEPASFNDFLKKFVRFINGVQNSPRDSITLKHAILLGGNGLLDEGGAYDKLFDNNFDEYKSLVDIERPFAWLRDAATLLFFEILCIYGYQNVIPIFASSNLYSKFIEYGGLIIKPENYETFTQSSERDFHIPHIEVVQSNYVELIEDETEWEQIKETRKDRESLRTIQAINQILTAEYRKNEKAAFLEQIDKTISDFEEASRKHGLQFRTAKKYMYLDIATATSLSFFSTLAFINGAPLPITLSALAGAVFSSTKAVMSFNEKKATIELPNNQIISYVEAAKEKIESKFDYIK